MSKPRPCLSDMPPEIKEQIIAPIDVFTRCALRKCSRDFRDLIDRSNSRFDASFDKINVFIERNAIRMGLWDRFENRIAVKYSPPWKSWLRRRRTYPDYERRVKCRKYVERAVSDLVSMIGSSRVEKLYIGMISGTSNRAKRAFFTSVQQKLSTVKHELKVESLEISCQLNGEEVLCILPYLEPATLKKIDITWCMKNDLLAENITSLEQWKQAKQLVLVGNAELSDLMHFRKVSLRVFDVDQIEFEMLVGEVIARCDSFETFYLVSQDPFHEMFPLMANHGEPFGRQDPEFMSTKILKHLDNGDKMIANYESHKLHIHTCSAPCGPMMYRCYRDYY